MFANNGNVDRVQLLLGGLTVFIAIVFLIIIYLVFIMSNPVAVIKDTRPLRDTAAPGETVSFMLNWCKNTNVTTDSVRQDWVGSLQLSTPTLPIFPANRPKGCAVLNVLVEVPHTLPPDTYTLNITRIYQVNLMARREVSYSVGPFFIVDGSREIGG